MASTPQASGGETPTAQASDHAALNGLADHVAAVEAARARLREDLDKLTVEVRAQMSRRMEETAWKVVGTGGAILAGILARKALIAAWTKSARMPNPPTNPASRTTSWGEAIGWTVASGVVVAIARLLAERGAAAGWQKAMGSLPPGLEEVTV
jgi:hypothetical protein